MTDIENLTEILRREREEKYSLELENAALKAEVDRLRKRVLISRITGIAEATEACSQEAFNALESENAAFRRLLSVYVHAYRTDNAPPRYIQAEAEKLVQI